MVHINKGMSRRSFLQQTAGVAAGAAALNSALKSWAAEAGVDDPLKDDRPIKLALIGSGNQALINLVPAALRIPGVKFTAVSDVVPARAEAAKRLVDPKGEVGTKVYTDYEQLLKESDADAVMIVTPLSTHHDIVLAAFKAGKHVFCEKCMAFSVEQCKSMLKAQMAANKILQIGHHLRYHPLYFFAKDHYVKKGLLGRVNNIHCSWNRNGSWRNPGIKAPEGQPFDFTKWGFERPDHLFNWRLYKKHSYGLMTELLSHQFDVINWFMDDKPVQAVQGVGRTDWKEMDRPAEERRTIFDNVHLIYEYPGEVQVTAESITTNSFCPYGVQAYEIFQGEKGTLVMAHLSRYVGLFFLEPGVGEELWMAQAHRIDVAGPQFENVGPERHRRPIVLNGTPSPGSQTEKVGNILPLEGLVNIEEAKVIKHTYEIELLGFKKCVLDKLNPFCDGVVGMKSAIPALVGYEAMEKQQRVVVDPKIYSLA